MLSVSATLVSPAGGTPNLVPVQGYWTDSPHYYVTPQSGEVDVKMTRPPGNARAKLAVRVDTLGSYV